VSEFDVGLKKFRRLKELYGGGGGLQPLVEAYQIQSQEGPVWDMEELNEDLAHAERRHDDAMDASLPIRRIGGVSVGLSSSESSARPSSESSGRLGGADMFEELNALHKGTQDPQFYKNDNGTWDLDALQADLQYAHTYNMGGGAFSMSSVGQDAAGAEEMADIFYPTHILPIIQHHKGISIDKVQRMNYEAALNNVHLLQTDNDVQPAMGAVHMVSASSNYHDKHFMFDIEGDINEGQRVMIEKSRKGPFRHESGRSTVMDRSAHITYRKRAGAMEITVKRGCIKQEMEQMMRKLVSHRLSSFGSLVTLIKGSKRYRLGKLSDINMRYLRELVEECIEQYGTCGVEITESSQAGRGSLYKSKVHGSRFKSAARRRAKGLENEF
jgi:hypothetical protein